jgi:ATP synthase protein I
MSKTPISKHKKDAATIVDIVAANAERKLRAEADPAPAVWEGFSTMGMIGWTIVVPTLIGAGIGRWLDTNHPNGHSWTLAMLAAGLTIGCATAWYWITNERNLISRGDDKHV